MWPNIFCMSITIIDSHDEWLVQNNETEQPAEIPVMNNVLVPTLCTCVWHNDGECSLYGCAKIVPLLQWCFHILYIDTACFATHNYNTRYSLFTILIWIIALYCMHAIIDSLKPLIQMHRCFYNKDNLDVGVMQIWSMCVHHSWLHCVLSVASSYP